MKNYKIMDINQENKDGYYKIFNILKEKSDDIFYKFGILMMSVFAILFALPVSIVVPVLLVALGPFFTLMYLVFTKKGFMTNICKKDIDEVKKQFPDLEFDTDICFNELEANLQVYNEKLNEEASNKYAEEKSLYEEKNEETTETNYNYEEMPNHEDVKIKVLGIKKK